MLCILSIGREFKQQKKFFFFYKASINLYYDQKRKISDMPNYLINNRTSMNDWQLYSENDENKKKNNDNDKRKF
jgi:hypothetical protein